MKTYTPTFEIEVECPHCGTEITANIVVEVWPDNSFKIIHASLQSTGLPVAITPALNDKVAPYVDYRDLELEYEVERGDQEYHERIDRSL